MLWPLALVLIILGPTLGACSMLYRYRMAQLRNSLEKATDQLREVGQQQSRTLRQYAFLQETHRALKTNYYGLRRRSRSLQCKYDNLKQEYDQLFDDSKGMLRAKDMEIKELRGRLQRVDGELEHYKQQFTSLSARSVEFVRDVCTELDITESEPQ